jgi:hypothetical protein
MRSMTSCSNGPGSCCSPTIPRPHQGSCWVQWSVFFPCRKWPCACGRAVRPRRVMWSSPMSRPRLGGWFESAVLRFGGSGAQRAVGAPGAMADDAWRGNTIGGYPRIAQGHFADQLRRVDAGLGGLGPVCACNGHALFGADRRNCECGPGAAGGLAGLPGVMPRGELR